MLNFYLVLDTGKKIHTRCGSSTYGGTKEYVKSQWIGKEMPDKSGKVIDVEF